MIRLPIRRDQIEMLVTGLFCIGIGIAISLKVSAETGKSITELCAPSTKPDASCTLPLQSGPETKICFGDLHSRCFELKKEHLYQSLSQAPVQDHLLTTSQIIEVRSIVGNYKSWLEAGTAKKVNKLFACRELVTIESKTERREFCLSALPKKEADEKTQALIASLEKPSLASVAEPVNMPATKTK